MKQDSNLESIAKKLKESQDMLAIVVAGVGTLQNDHLTEELVKFCAMKNIFDGRVVKFFLDRRRYVRIKEFENIRKLFGVRKKERK
jgi:hypothetical protein